jgi:hypothetical protein
MLKMTLLRDGIFLSLEIGHIKNFLLLKIEIWISDEMPLTPNEKVKWKNLQTDIFSLIFFNTKPFSPKNHSKFLSVPFLNYSYISTV